MLAPIANGSSSTAAEPVRRRRATDEIPAHGRSRPKRRRWPFALVTVLLLTLAALVLADSRPFGDERGAVSVPSTSQPQGSARPSPNGAVDGENPTQALTPSASTDDSERSRATRQGADRADQGSEASPRANSLAPVKNSLFVWLPRRRASHYRVEFRRAGRKIFQATTARPRLLLPDRWVYNGRGFRLTPGRYRWTVRPAFGSRANPRYGTPIVDSRWRVPPQ